jgi:hypothetical protein
MEQIFLELHGINEQYVGETCREIEVYLTLTQQDRDLRQRLKKWTAGYIEHRVAQHDPKDNRNPIQTFKRLCCEFDRIFGDVGNLQNTINYLFADETISYARWLVHDALVGT